MARKTGRPALVISTDEREKLERLRDERTGAAHELLSKAGIAEFAAGASPEGPLLRGEDPRAQLQRSPGLPEGAAEPVRASEPAGSCPSPIRLGTAGGR